MKFPVVFHSFYFFFSPLLSSEAKKLKNAARPIVLHSNWAKTPKVLSLCPDGKDSPLCIWRRLGRTNTSANGDHEDC